MMNIPEFIVDVEMVLIPWESDPFDTKRPLRSIIE
jgi:hypothetical protein